MNSQKPKEIIETCFENQYSEESFRKFIINILKDNFETINHPPYQGACIYQAFSDHIKSYKRLYKYESKGRFTDKIDVLAVNLKNSQTIKKSRSLQRNFIANYLEDREKDAVLVAFYSDENLDDWKFSFISRKLYVEDGQVKSSHTSPKRMSFLVGKNEKSHTAKKQFLPILTDDNLKLNLKHLEEAFSTEKVTDEFYEKYKELFLRGTEALDLIIKNDPKIKTDFANKDINSVDFVKKTLGQMAFLYFLQKKGWFGVQENEDWGTGNKHFLRQIFDNKKDDQNFFNDILEPLFYEALAQDRGNTSIYERLNCRMPFLNGGLFEPMNGYLWETTSIILPDTLFSNTNETSEGDIGNGILDVFDRYNFTVNENEPLEKEVAVDPEMLGKVFENLLEIKDRKSKGAFYTPREIVHYMCQESLINYLISELSPDDQKINRQNIEFFIKKSDQIIENDQKVIANEKETETYAFKLHLEIRQNAKKIDDLLANIKVCDPAVGSGAFALGMLNEIVKARSALATHLNKPQDIYQLKLDTISNSIYGVDLDSGAVEIAKLRLWLALVVEETEPRPLPNLDHKIMQGNSLLSEFEGIKLFDDNILENAKQKEQEIAQINQKLKELDSQILQEGSKSLQKSQNPELQQKNTERSKIQKTLDNLKNPKPADTTITDLFDDGKKQELTKKSELLQQKIKEFIFENQRSKKENLKAEIEQLKWQLIEATLEDQGKIDRLEEVKKLRHKNIRPFFIWKLEFCDVFSQKNGDVFRQKKGFDVVIGNPPYIQLQKNGGELANMFEKVGFKTFARAGDIYCLFYEFGNQILNQNGHLAFITSNKWMRAGYGKKLRQYLSVNTNPKILIDLGPGVFETATVDTNILLFQKAFLDSQIQHQTEHQTECQIKCLSATVKENLKKKNIQLEDYLADNAFYLSKFCQDAWIIAGGIEAKIKAKIEKIGTKLKDWDSGIEEKIKAKIEKIGTKLKDWDIKINRGILTGFNEAFIIDGKIKDQLIAKDAKSAEIIKPILRGKDIKRYAASFADKWVILSHNGYKKENGEIVKAIEIKNYPAIKDWLDKYWQEIEKRQDKGKTPYNLRNCAYQKEFEKEKIVYSETAQSPNFFISEEFVVDKTNFIMTGNDLKYLVALLSSKTLTYFFKKYCGGALLGKKGYQYNKHAIEKLPIPQIPPEEQQPFIKIVDEILAITNLPNYNPKNPPQDLAFRQKQLEAKIDEMVFDLYDLNDEERRVVGAK
jgi:hypothetical protein